MGQHSIAFWVLGALGTLNIIYGALCAMAQQDLKKLVAYSSISHMGYVMLGMAAFTAQGINGAVLQMFNHGTITAMLFLLVGVIYDRAHHRDINGFGGLASIMPLYTGVTGFAFFAAMGIPGLSAFISEVLVLLGRGGIPRATIAASAVCDGGLHARVAAHVPGARRIRATPPPGGDQRPRALRWSRAAIVIFLGIYPKAILSLQGPRLIEIADRVKAAAPAARGVPVARHGHGREPAFFGPELVLIAGISPSSRSTSSAAAKPGSGPAPSPSSPPSSRSSRRSGCRVC
jgi:NADH-quinone oxidoreductase subunit M